MASPIQGIIRNVLKNPLDKCNILSIMYDGFFEQLLSTTQHNFFVLLNEQPNWLTQTINSIDNVKLCKDTKDIPPHISIDAILCNNRVKFYDQSRILSRLCHAPLIIVDHLDMSNLKQEDIYLINKNTGDFHICSSNLFGQISHVNYTDIIQYGVDVPADTMPIKDREYNIVVLGDYDKNQQVLSVLKNQFGAIIINKDNHPRSFDEIATILQNTKIYINMSTDSSISIPAIKAMSYGCVIVNNQRNPLSKIFNVGNGIVYNNDQHLLECVQQLLNNEDKLQTISRMAVQNTKLHFNKDRFISQWNLICSQLTNITYKL